MKNISATNGLNNTSSLSAEDLPSKTAGIAWCSAFALEAVFIVAGNLLTIVLFTVNKNLRKKSLALVVNMAFADLILGAVCLPIYIYFVGGSYHLWTDRFHTASLNLSFYIVDTVFSQASLISAALISVERFYATYWPLKHRTLSMRSYRTVIFMTWALAICVSTVVNILSQLVSTKHAYYVFIPYALVLLFILCGSNIGIWTKFRQGSIGLHQQNRALSALQNKRLTKTLLFVSVLVFLSWLPLLINNYLIFVYEVSKPLHSYYIDDILNYLNSCVNPVVYALRIPEFSKALGLYCLRGRAELDTEDDRRRNNRAAALTTQLRTLPTEPSL